MHETPAIQTEDHAQLILDIGTHKVLGLAVRLTADGVEVLAASLRTHPGRAMRDGQVHDVPAVARTVRQVVDEIEHSLGTSFTQAYIAAAGRALHTARGRAEHAEQRPTRFTTDMNRAVEWNAVGAAQTTLLATLPREERAKGFYCIAHSRTSSTLDGEPIASLIDQRGTHFAVDVLATFLPGVVVDSLEAVLAHANLQMRGLTLEPVAALQAVVPETMRHLHLVLVDVGAGTADIAFTGAGTVQAFGMVPLGGDSITEALATPLLLDFSVAEQAKRAVSYSGDTARVENVLGQAVTIDRDDLEQAIRPAIEGLAAAIVRTVAAWNLDSPPDAVLLVGGGSNTPGFAAALAHHFDMPPERVAVRDRSAVRGVAGGASLQGPDVVTALGIALRFAHDKEMPPVRVRVNGRPVSLFQPERFTVREAARIAGMPLEQLVGRLGQGMTVTVNDAMMTIPGNRGQIAIVQVNGMGATLDTLLQTNDDVALQMPVEGDAARITVGQLVDRWLQQRQRETGQAAPRIQLNGSWRPLPLAVERNGVSARMGDIVADRDVLDVSWPQTVGELLTGLGPETGSGHKAGSGLDPRHEYDAGSDLDTRPEPIAETERPPEFRAPFNITLNGEPTTLDVPAELRLNGTPVGLSARIEDGDRLDAEARTSVAIYELLSHPRVDAVRRSGTEPAILGADPRPTADRPVGVRPRQLILLVQGEPAGFTTLVHDGDEVTIRYE